jgi:hypothetical protein
MWRVRVVINGPEGSVTDTVANEVFEEMSNAGTRRLLKDRCSKDERGVERSPSLFEVKKCKVTGLPGNSDEWALDFRLVTIWTDYNTEEANQLLSEAIAIFGHLTESTARSLSRRLE